MRDTRTVSEATIYVPTQITAYQLQRILDTLEEERDTLLGHEKLLETTTLNTLFEGVKYLARTVNPDQQEIINALHEGMVDLLPTHLLLKILLAGHRKMIFR